jgi:hypothetical protein
MLETIKTQFDVINTELFTINSSKSYDDVVTLIIELANNVHAYSSNDIDSYDLWTIGEFGECSLDNFIIGAYWHFTEYHAGQYSDSYAALCALGNIFSPGMSCGPEPETSEQFAYEMLNDLAEKEAA